MSAVYVTAQEFQDWPTGLNVQNLVGNGDAAAQTAQLDLIMQSASSYVEQLTFLKLYAHQRTETRRVTPNPYGFLEVRCRDFPLISVTSAQWRQTQPSGWNPITVANLDIYGALSEGHKYIDTSQDYAFFNGWGLPPLTVQSTYVAGYANALLTSNAAVGATTLDLDDVTGILVGDTLTLYDGANLEQVAVSAVTPSTTPTVIAGISQYPGTVTVGATQYAHNKGVRASELPSAVSVATIYIAAWMIKERRAGGGMSMAGKVQELNTRISEDMQMAKELLKPFTAVMP